MSLQEVDLKRLTNIDKWTVSSVILNVCIEVN